MSTGLVLSPASVQKNAQCLFPCGESWQSKSSALSKKCEFIILQQHLSDVEPTRTVSAPRSSRALTLSW